MATTRINIDTKGKNILELFMSNMNELAAINKLSAGKGDANTYAGNGGEIDITWPRAGEYNNTGVSPMLYQRYFVREVNVPPAAAPSVGEEPAVRELINEIDNDTHPEESAIDVVADRFGGKSPRTLEYSDNPYSNTNAVGTSEGDYQAGNFFKNKHRKSLYTLLQETWGVFFDPQPVYRNASPANQIPAANSNEFNRYFGEGDRSGHITGGTKTYDFGYMSEQGSSFVDPPTTADLANSAMQGFVVGQIYGGADPTIQEKIRREAQKVAHDYFDQSAAAAEVDGDDSLRDFYRGLAAMVGENVGRISQLYVPGWGRPAENYLTRKSLSENLNQNLLLPPATRTWGPTSPLSMPGNINDNGTGPPGHGDTAANFESLYTRNRAGAAGGVNVSNPLFNNGILGGMAINLLQEPAGMSAGVIKADPTTPVPTTTTVPFSFERDDAQYLTYDRKETGFTSNGPNTNAQPSKMEPAVSDTSIINSEGDHVSRAAVAREAVSFGQGQFFPFTFSTLNKKDPGGAIRHQVCYLQAIINSLSEAYAPTWASKHFFGRTEQVHTYTFTSRTIDLSFTIFANEMRQLQNVYERILWLAQQCYPDFDITGRVSEGPLVALRVGDLFQYKAGIIRSLSYDWMFAGGKWEMTAGMRMPQGVSVTMSYEIIHNTVPSRNTDFYGGPAGGLNAATERYRQLGSSDTTDSAFDSFSTMDPTGGNDFGYGTRLLDETISTDEEPIPGDPRGFLNEIKKANYLGIVEADVKDDLKVPVGVSGTVTEDNPNGIQWAL
jgi:hypothetical protein